MILLSLLAKNVSFFLHRLKINKISRRRYRILITLSKLSNQLLSRRRGEKLQIYTYFDNANLSQSPFLIHSERIQSLRKSRPPVRCLCISKIFMKSKYYFRRFSALSLIQLMRLRSM